MTVKRLQLLRRANAAPVHGEQTTKSVGVWIVDKRTLEDAAQVRMAQTLYADGRVTVPEICQSLRISRATFYRYIALARQDADGIARK
jgi:predicted transcriptional regulator YheO